MKILKCWTVLLNIKKLKIILNICLKNSNNSYIYFDNFANSVATDLLQIDKDQLTTHHWFDKIDEFMCYLYLIVEQNWELMQAGVLKVVKEVYK